MQKFIRELARINDPSWTYLSFYGSKAKPKEIFGEETKELAAFYSAAQQLAPGAWELLHIFRETWNPATLVHQWRLPDGYLSYVKVEEKFEKRIEIDEFDHATFEFKYVENTPLEYGLSNIANITHSIDAYVLRNMERRCNYDHKEVIRVLALLETLPEFYNMSGGPIQGLADDALTGAYERFEKAGIVDTSILPLITETNVITLPEVVATKLKNLLEILLEHKPFEIITVHDEFRALPGNLNQLRFHYKEILADLADSTIVADILSQLYMQEITYTKHSENLSTFIRNSNYALS